MGSDITAFKGYYKMLSKLSDRFGHEALLEMAPYERDIYIGLLYEEQKEREQQNQNH